MFGLSLWLDDSSYCVQFELMLTSLTAYKACSPGSTVTVDLAGETWTFFVDSRTRSNVFGEAEYRITGRSISALLDNTVLHETWEQKNASVIVSELAALEGISVDWQIIDWIIPAGRLEANGETPIQIITRIANAAGGIVQSDPDGTLKIYYAYEWDAVPTVSYGIDTDIISLNESLNVLPHYNLVRISDQQYEEDSQITLEETEKDEVNLTCKIIAWIHPWTDSFSLESLATDVIINYEGKVTEDHEQWVEFKAGSGVLEKPARSIISVDYGDHPDLGTLSFSGTSVWSQSKTWSLAYIKYQKSYHVFGVVRSLSKPVQILAT